MGRSKFSVVVQPLEGRGSLAVCPALQGCHAEGSTVSESVENLKDVVRAMIELRREDGTLREILEGLDFTEDDLEGV